MLLSTLFAYTINENRMIRFAAHLGLISLQVGDTFILHSNGNTIYTFERGLLQAAGDGDLEAVEFLLQYCLVDVNAPLQFDEEYMKQIAEAADKLRL